MRIWKIFLDIRVKYNCLKVRNIVCCCLCSIVMVNRYGVPFAIGTIIFSTNALLGRQVILREHFFII